jgi:glycerate 2-kinase
VRVLVAPASFKGCLSAAQAAEAMSRGVRAGGGDPVSIPVADGGEGTLDALVTALGGSVMGVIARGPLGLPVRAHVGLLSDGTGVVEMAQASGLTLVEESERDPMRATSYGTGEMIRGALARRPARILVGLGGSATVDGGMGIARALGVRFLDSEGHPLIDGASALERIARIDAARLDPRMRATPLAVACDVTHPLLGSDGAARAFGPQKGATREQVEALERGMERLAERLKADLHADVADRPGAGAAGGAGAMLAALGGELRPGIDVVLEAAGFAERLRGVGLVLTGEGRFDGTSLGGKAPVGVADRAAAAGVPCVAIVGEAEEGLAGPFSSIRSLVEHFGDRSLALAGAADGLASLVAAVVRSYSGAPSRRG